MGERFATFLHRYRRWLLAAWVLHAFALHYALLGFISWDGLNYRVPPVIELMQHGSFELDKYYNQWANAGLVPFVELLQLPFLYVFDLQGLIIGFPLVIFPLCVAAVYACARELTGDPRSATFGALAYAAMPMINQQPYAGYIDFVVSALLACFVYALLRVRAGADRRAFARLAVATLLFTMSRSQAVYIVIALVPVLSYALFCRRDGWRVRAENRRALAVVLGAAALGAVPAVAIQIYKLVHYGSPTYPLQFELLGLRLGHGLTTMKHYFRYAGLADDSAGEMARALVRGWIWPSSWPLGGFYDSRTLGGGFVLPIALVLSPVFLRHATRAERWLVPTCLVLSLLARDFVHPRYAYAMVFALVVVVARALPALLSTRRGAPLFWAASVLLLAHFLRPEIDLAQLRTREFVSPRLNVTESPYFVSGVLALQPFPDLGARFVIVEPDAKGFVVPIYGPRLRNEVTAVVPVSSLGEHCAGLARFLARDPEVMFVDEQHTTVGCKRTCAFTTRKGTCRAWRIQPGQSDRPPPLKTVRLGDRALDDAKADDAVVRGFRYPEGDPPGFRWTVASPAGTANAGAAPSAELRVRLAPGRAYRATATVWGARPDQWVRVRVNDTEVVPTTTLGAALSRHALDVGIPADALDAGGLQRIVFEFDGVNADGVGIAVQSIDFSLP